MNSDYKTQITERVKEGVNNWIGELKTKHPELLLTRQWQLLWPRGFEEGHNVVPVVTSAKQGQHLVAEARFVLPPSMELDLDALELSLKDEVYDPSARDLITPTVDNPLETLSSLVQGINGFLESLTIKQKPAVPSDPFGSIKARPFSAAAPLSIQRPWESARLLDSTEVEQIREAMEKSPFLPEWYATITSQKVADELLTKLAEGYLHQRSLGRTNGLKEYFEQYTAYLQKENKVHQFCHYKGKPVKFDEKGWCLEAYCSKKPYQAVCPRASLRFGSHPDD